MKTLKQFATILLLSCCFIVANAQCGVNGGWRYTINPNNVHVFTDTSSTTGNFQITNRYWSFGDGSTSNLPNPTHQYANPGIYTVCEYVLGSNGVNNCIDTVCQQVSNCNGMVQAAISANVQGTAVVYVGTGTSNYPPLSYSWTFAGGSPATSNTAVTTVQYNAPGVHTACLTVRDTNGCSATVCRNDTTTVSACGITPNFTASQYNNKVTLTSTSSGTTPNTLYQWFKDGVALTSPNPNTSFLATGVTVGAHTFCLKVYASSGVYCDSICKNITLVNCAGTASFQTTLQNNVATFYPAYSGGAPNYWSFGDGSSGVNDTSWQVIHTFPSSPNTQVYTVTHIRLYGPCADTVYQQITIPGTTTCGNASFTSSQTSGSLVLTSTSTGTNTNVVWAIRNLNGVGVLTGSGTPFTANTLPNGTYQVCLYLYNNNQQLCDTTCQTIAVTNSNPCGNLNTSFTYSVRNNWVFISGTSTGTTSSTLFKWVLNGVAGQLRNNDQFGVVPIPTGTNTVCLMAYSGPTLCDSACSTFVVDSCPASAGPFQYTAQNNVVTFFPLSSGGTLNSWTFGDGTATSSTSSQLTHTYPTSATSQTYIVLLVRIAGTCHDSIWQQIVVPASTACGTASFTSSQTSGHLVLTSTSTGTNTNVVWAIRNMNGAGVLTGSGTPFTANTLPNGTYQVCLYLYNNNQQLCDTTCQTIAVTNSNPCTGLTANWTQTYNANNSVTFAAANTISGATYAWNFGDGQTSTLANPTHGYLNAGVFTVCLIVRIPGSICADTLCRNIQANPVNTCNATASIAATTNGNGSKTLTATATGLGTSVTYAWSNAATTQAITVTAPGQYCVTITGNNICSATACYSFTPTPCGTASFTATQSGGRVVLTSTSTGTNNQYVWAIRTQNGTGVATGSGSPFTSPVLANGVYQVCLYLYSSNQTLCDTTCQYVTVNTSNPCLGVSAQWTKTYNTNNSISFTASNQASGNTYLWTFGDGTSATTAAPVHGYTTAGLYNVCLIVRRTGTFCADTVCQNLQANPANTCTAVASFTTTTINGSILATSTSTNVNSNSHYYWNVYGSNNNLIQSQSGTNTQFQSQVLPAGTYQVCLYLFGNNTQTFCDSACSTVTIVNANPCAGLNADYTYAYLTSGGVQFYPVTNAGTTTHYWNFGDGTTSTNADPIYYYTTAGLYTICHAVQIPGTNCFDSTCTTIQVTAGNPCSGFGVQVNVTSGWFTARHLEPVVAGGTAPYTYLWSNGATTRAIYPTTTGNYCVTVYDANQCSATDCETFTSNTPPCNASYSYTRVNCSTIQFTNASTGGYTNVVWNFGDGTSSSATNPTHSFGVGTWTVQLTVYSNGSNCQASYYQVITIQPCGINDTICGVVFNDINGNGVQESSEPGIGGGTIYAGNYQVTVSSNGLYTLILPAGNYTLYYCAAPGNSFTIPVGTQNPNSNTSTCAYYTITTSGGSHCGYNFGVQNNSSTVCGTVYFDANNNQVQDAGETGQANAHVIITRSNGTVVHSYADQSGHYCVTLFPGTYTLTVQTPAGFTLTPQAITLTTVAGTNYYNNNFGLYTQPGSCNLRLDIVPHTTITAGFAAWYDLIVTNLGASTSDGTVSMFFDPALTFTSASPAQTSANNSTHTVSWDFTGITPGGTRRFLANFRALTNIQINQPVFTLANVTSTNCNEVNFTDNIDTVHQNVTASWDPNNKLVVPDGIIKGDERLTYTVNFQNTGTAPAVNVVLRDMIAPELDIETFEMVGASHPYSLQFAGREAIWKFTAIMLPDSNSNEPQSHGHVTFSMLPKANLGKGTQITNTADIYFDYNAPVGTNSTLNTIDYELSVADLENGKVAITLMPNPFKEFTTIKIDGENTAYELKMFDMLGQQIYQDRTTNNLFSIQRQTLAAGVYMYQITKQGKVIGQGKMIAE